MLKMEKSQKNVSLAVLGRAEIQILIFPGPGFANSTEAAS